jgi:hypothetical protein
MTRSQGWVAVSLIVCLPLIAAGMVLGIVAAWTLAGIHKGFHLVKDAIDRAEPERKRTR